MKHGHTQNFTFLDDEERELAHLDPKTVLLDAEKDKETIAFRKASASGRKSVTVRMEITDLEKLRTLAEREGIPYQTLLGSIVHKYVCGFLVDVAEVKKVVKV
jgi:predicted DNA binding CopG/RHH family protein